MSDEESMAESRREGAVLNTQPKQEGRALAEWFGLEKGREGESISVRVWLCATGWIQWTWPSEEGAK